MRAHVACRAAEFSRDETAGCFLVCPQHGRQSFGFAHRAATEACAAHNLELHP